MTPERFARGMTFDDYVKFTGSPENLGREGFDVRRFSLVRPRVDWSGFLRERYANARLTDDQKAAITWLAAQPGGPAKVLVLSEDWSSDCRRDVPYLARLAEAGGLELRIFVRDGDTMLRKGLPATSSIRPSTTRTACSVCCARRARARRRNRPRPAADATSRRCSSLRSSTCGRGPASPRF